MFNQFFTAWIYPAGNLAECPTILECRTTWRRFHHMAMLHAEPGDVVFFYASRESTMDNHDAPRRFICKRQGQRNPRWAA